MLNRHTAPTVMLAAPAVVVALAACVALGADVVGPHPLWRAAPVNMAEAAALRDAATVARLLRDGEDPDERRPVRQGPLGDRTVVMTPLEAGIAARRADVVELLITARPDQGNRWMRARCLALAAPDDAVFAVLERHRPPGADPGAPCPPTAPPW